MVRSRSPSSSPVRSAKSPDGVPGSHSAGALDHEPAEVPITVNYCGMPGAGSPPQSAKSVKENASPFKFSYRDSIRKYDRKAPPPITHEKHGSHTSVTAAEPQSGHHEPRPVSPPDTVQAKIRQFNARDRQRPISPPMRDRHRPVSPPSRDRHRPVSPPTRDRYRPVSPPRRPAYQDFPPIPAPIPKPPTNATDKFKPKPETTDETAAGKSLASNGESGRFSPSSSTTSADSTLSSGSSVTTIKAPASGAFGQAYVSSICSSDESLTESSSLLKEEEKITSPSQLCIYFDKKGFPDTLV